MTEACSPQEWIIELGHSRYGSAQESIWQPPSHAVSFYVRNYPPSSIGVPELRRAGASTLAEANAVLATYLPKHNQRFAIPAQQSGAACRPLPASCHLEWLFSFRYTRRVANDPTIYVDSHCLPLPPAPNGRSYARATVELYHAMDGRLTVTYRGQDLTTFLPAVAGPPRVDHFCPHPSPTTHQSKPAEPVTLPLPKPVRSTPKPAANHPWRKMIQRDVERHRPPEATTP